MLEWYSVACICEGKGVIGYHMTHVLASNKYEAIGKGAERFMELNPDCVISQIDVLKCPTITEEEKYV